MVQSMTSLGKWSANKNAIYLRGLHYPRERSSECRVSKSSDSERCTSSSSFLATQAKVSVRVQSLLTLLSQQLSISGSLDKRVKLGEVEAARHGHRSVGLSDVPRGWTRASSSSTQGRNPGNWIVSSTYI